MMKTFTKVIIIIISMLFLAGCVHHAGHYSSYSHANGNRYRAGVVDRYESLHFYPVQYDHFSYEGHPVGHEYHRNIHQSSHRHAYHNNEYDKHRNHDKYDEHKPLTHHNKKRSKYRSESKRERYARRN